jgi:glycosyltransferase involved in cell wall biosynthesis
VIPQGAFAAGLLGLPHIWRITEFGLPEFGIEYLIEEHIRKQFIVAGSEKIIFVSNALRKTYSPYSGKDQDVTMYSAVRDLMNKTSIDPFEKKPLLKIICPSTICQGKRQEDIITAVHLLDQKGIQSVLVGLIGDVTSEEYGKKLNELIRRYQLESRVEILPFADNLWDKYRDAEMVVSTSVNEGYGRIVVEGMAHGKFVIGTDSGATRELICHGETGLLYQPGDPEDLAKKILQYINESVDIRQIRQNAFDFVYRNCHPEQYKKQITQIIREIIFNGHKTLKNYTLCFDVFYISYLEMLFNEYKNLAEELKVLKDKQASTYNSCQELGQNISSKEYEISSLRSSLSWKMTSPVRYLHSWIYNLLKRSR